MTLVYFEAGDLSFDLLFLEEVGVQGLETAVCDIIHANLVLFDHKYIQKVVIQLNGHWVIPLVGVASRTSVIIFKLECIVLHKPTAKSPKYVIGKNDQAFTGHLNLVGNHLDADQSLNVPEVGLVYLVYGHEVRSHLQILAIDNALFMALQSSDMNVGNQGLRGPHICIDLTSDRDHLGPVERLIPQVPNALFVALVNSSEMLTVLDIEQDYSSIERACRYALGSVNLNAVSNFICVDSQSLEDSSSLVQGPMPELEVSARGEPEILPWHEPNLALGARKLEGLLLFLSAVIFIILDYRTSSNLLDIVLCEMDLSLDTVDTLEGLQSDLSFDIEVQVAVRSGNSIAAPVPIVSN